MQINTNRDKVIDIARAFVEREIADKAAYKAFCERISQIVKPGDKFEASYRDYGNATPVTIISISGDCITFKNDISGMEHWEGAYSLLGGNWHKREEIAAMKKENE